MNKKHLSLHQRLLVAATLFGMFFGAGNLIFPVHLGQLAGRNLLPAMAGFIIAAVGIPILGVAAIGNTHSDGLQALASKVSRRYSYFFTCLLYLTIGPCFAIPRCATTSFTTGIQPVLGSQISERTALLVFFFSAIFLPWSSFSLFKNRAISPSGSEKSLTHCFVLSGNFDPFCPASSRYRCICGPAGSFL